jgi:hypothetical protein
MMPFERQLTSPADQQFARQATSPFDLTSDLSLLQIQDMKDKMKLLGERKVELSNSFIKLVLVINPETYTICVFVSGGGLDGAKIGERFEVVDWAKDTGMSVNFNGKRCYAGGALSDLQIEPKAQKSAQKFAQAISDSFNSVPFVSILITMAKFAEDTPLTTWRAHMLGQCLTPGFVFRPLSS